MTDFLIEHHERSQIAESLGRRIADAFLLWCWTDDPRHLARSGRFEREFNDWMNARHHPELVP